LFVIVIAPLAKMTPRVYSRYHYDRHILS